ncbi:MAG TPA: DUF2203 domain-containing protein [Candidatus Dormibacteraeota bacterium]|jgi:hypothetical protein|nr:DUF2203 domain-containing protein [Candidatus Dormibacteraeota bacterium]
MEARLFSLEEANSLLPRLRPLLERAQQVSVVLGDRDRQRKLRSVTVGNGGGEAAREMMAEGDELNRVVEEIARMGVLVRDPSTGLVDFPAERDGEPIYLCWRLGEDDIAFWHDRDSGFAGRQAL